MSTINLLPWREAHIQFQNRIFFSIVGVIATIVFIIMYIFNSVIVNKIFWEKQELSYLRTEISELNNQIREIKGLQDQRELLLERRSVIEKLQGSRSVVVSILDDIARSIPRDTHLIGLSKAEEKLLIVGETESNARVANFLQALKSLSWSKDVKLVELNIVNYQPEDSEEINSKTIFYIEVLVDSIEESSNDERQSGNSRQRFSTSSGGRGRR